MLHSVLRLHVLSNVFKLTLYYDNMEFRYCVFQTLFPNLTAYTTPSGAKPGLSSPTRRHGLGAVSGRKLHSISFDAVT
jgi:hypothetical protein